MSASAPSPSPISSAMPTSDDLAWLAVLAGTQQPDARDTEQRQAAQLRGYFAQRDAHEQANPLPATTQARLMQRLREQGAFKPPAPTLAQRLQALLDWLLPPGTVAGPRYALVAGVVMAAVVVPALVGQMGEHSDADNPATVRSLPATPGSGTANTIGTTGNTDTTAPALLVISPDASAQAAALQQSLQQAGASVSLQPGAQGEIRLVAQVPEAARQAVAQAMLPWGLAQIPDTLVISVQPVAP